MAWQIAVFCYDDNIIRRMCKCRLERPTFYVLL